MADSADGSVDDDEWPNEGVWLQVVRLTREVFGLAESDFALGSDRFDPFVVDAALLQPGKLPRAAGLLAAEQLRKSLALHVPGNWTVRIWVAPIDHPQELLVWLEVDRFRVAEFLGKQSSQRFDHLTQFVKATWGESSVEGTSEI